MLTKFATYISQSSDDNAPSSISSTSESSSIVRKSIPKTASKSDLSSNHRETVEDKSDSTDNPTENSDDTLPIVEEVAEDFGDISEKDESELEKK